MNTEEAKAILQSYRPHLDDANDPIFKEALLFAENDKEVRSWLEREQSFDNIFAQKLQGIEPPANLKEKILSNLPSSTADTESEIFTNFTKVIWWRQPLTWSVAACFIALFTLGVVLLRPREQIIQAQPAMEALVQAVNEHSRTVSKLDYQNNDVVALQDFLMTNNSPAPQSLPANLQNLNGIGCLSFTWQGHQLGLICFQGDKIYHLYVTEQKGIPGLKSPKYHQFNDQSSATWTNDDQLYILTTEGEPKDLASLL
jgi:hypothetical protein